MIELESVTLEDGLEYLVISSIVSDDVTYLYLTDETHEENCCIRKINNTNKDTIVPLDSEEELLKALNLFREKNS